MDRICNNSARRDDRRFAATLRRTVFIVYDRGLYLRNPGEPGNIIGIEIVLVDITANEPNAFLQSVTQPIVTAPSIWIVAPSGFTANPWSVMRAATGVLSPLRGKFQQHQARFGAS